MKKGMTEVISKNYLNTQDRTSHKGGSFMKRLAVCLSMMLAVVFMVCAGIADTLDFDPVEPVEWAVTIEGNQSFDNCETLSEGVFYQMFGTSDAVEGWRKFIPAETGLYSFYVRQPSADTGNWYSGYRFSILICDKYGTQINNWKVQGNYDNVRVPEVYRYELEAGTTYYFKGENMYGAWARTDTYFAICSPTKHIGALSDEEVIQEPTCTEPGYKAQRCLLCGGEVNRTEIPVLGHTPGEEIIAKMPTCTETGEKYTRCMVCGTDLGAEVIPAAGHKPGEEEILVEPTCTTEGEKAEKCLECDQILSRETLPPAPHQGGQYIQVVAPTCTTKGRNEQHCLVCNALMNTEETEAYGHIPGAWEDVLPVTATSDGLRVQRCAVCGETLASETVKAPSSGD